MDIKDFVNQQLLKTFKKTAPGIYFLYCSTNNKIYIGSSINMADRHWHHTKDLVNKKHSNSHLQRAWDKYGPSSFSFGIIENVDDKRNLKEREQYWFDTTNCYDSQIGFNICKIAENSLGYKHTQECKDRMSILKKGKKLSLEHRAKISINGRGRNSGSLSVCASITEATAYSIKEALLDRKESYAKIATKFNTTEGVVVGIAVGKTWRHIEGSLPILSNGRDPNIATLYQPT